MKQIAAVVMLLIAIPCLAQAGSCKQDQYKGDDSKCHDWPKIASIEQVFDAGTSVNYTLPQGTSINVSWHVFLQEPSGKIDTVEGISYCEKGSIQDCQQASITFTLPQDYKEGYYRVIGAKFFNETVVLNDKLHVMPYWDHGVDKDDAKFVAERQGALNK